MVCLDNVDDMNDAELFKLLDQIKNEEIQKNSVVTSRKFCNRCQTEDYVTNDISNGNAVCTGCGEVVSNIMDSSPEWRNYDDSKKSVSRCSAPTNHFLTQSSLGTSIACSSRSKIKILHGWSSMPYKERSLHNVLLEIQNRCRSASILKCIEDDAKILYKNISECKHLTGKNKGKSIIIRGKNRKSLIAACVYFACKKKNCTRSQKEIATIFDLEFTDITKGCKTFLKLLKIKQMEYECNSSTPEHFVKRFCTKLKMDKDYITKTVDIAKNIQKLNIASKHTPLSVATGSILLIVDMYNMQLTKKNIASNFGVSEVTITKAYKKLEQYKDIIADNSKTDAYLTAVEKRKQSITMPKTLLKRYNEVVDNSFELAEAHRLMLSVNKNVKDISDKHSSLMSSM